MPSSDVTTSVIAVLAGEPSARVAAMLDAVAAQDAPGAMEMIVAAPPADHAELRPLLACWGRGPVTLLDNPGGSRSRGLNACIAAARGRIVVRVDARSRVTHDHVRRCLARLDAEPTVTIVGGHQLATVSADAGVRARGIARALRHPNLVGGAPYRRPAASGDVDTVYLGAFRRDDAVAYDEALAANEDYDVCARVRAAGGTVFLEPGLDVAYEPRTRYRGLFAQYAAFGAAKAAYWRFRASRPRGRQLAALTLVPVAIAGALILGLRWPVTLPVLALVAGATYLLLDAIGERGPASLRTRLAAVTAHVVIETGWCVGIVVGVRRARNAVPSGSGDVEHALERDAGELGGHRVHHDPVHHLTAHE
jgi:succinoglycan biosynthesis protein ExoA